MTIYVQRETDDWVKKTHYQDDADGNPQPYTGSWSYQIVPYGSRPTGTWLTAVVNASNKGMDVTGLSKGDYVAFYRIDGQDAYAPVLDPEFIIVA